MREGSDKDRWIKKNWFWEVGVGGMRGSDGRVKQEERKVDAQDYWHGWGIKTDCFSGFQDQWIEQPCSNLKFISKFYCSFIHPSIHACMHPFMHPSVFLSLFAVMLLAIEFFQRILQRAGFDFLFIYLFFGLFVLVEQACSNMLFIANFPYNPHSWAQILSNLIWSNAPFFLRQMKKWKTPFVKFLSIYWPAWWKVHLGEGFKDQDLMKIIIFISKNIVIELAKYNLRWTAAHGILHHVNNYFTKIRQQCKSSVKSVK